MATYKGIQGYTVQSLSSDPPDSTSVGQLWYNNDSGAYKIGTSVSGSWSAGGALNTARSMMGGTGSQTAALAFFGAAPGDPSGAVLVSEEYNGTAWTNSTSGTSRRYNGGSIGQTSTDAGYAGGYGAPPPRS